MIKSCKSSTKGLRTRRTCRALDSCQDLSELLAHPESVGSPAALAAGLGEKANVLSGLLASKRTYIERFEGSKGGFEGHFDPHFLVFEFVTGFLLRPRQVEMVDEFSLALKEGRSSVKQMIMGAGKTSVVSPLLALMHANGSRIVCLVVPPALISLSRSVLQRSGEFQADFQLETDPNRPFTGSVRCEIRALRPLRGSGTASPRWCRSA